MKRTVLGFFILLVPLFLLPPLTPLHALKKRIRAPKVAGISYSSARLSRSTNSIVVTLSHLDKTKRVEYVLSYAANGIQQGAMGTLVPMGQLTDSRDLYFGTCSHGVCTPHYNIRNATFTVTTTLTTGATYIKRYRLRI
ncbi:hypothetical protein HYV22_02455 [Candidatus Gottesmanbacteria bacterium]|nr:hypothetical protein [Candidatus Gottesmanbacteria bacterium]